MKTTLIDNLNKIADGSKVDGYNLQIRISDWNQHDKSRTYFSITETRDANRNYRKEKKYGYYDNVSKKYFPDKYNDLSDTLYTFSGSKLTD